MSDHPYHKSLRLQHFTVFADTCFDFVPGINVFVGENGTGKTHLMKAMYAMQVHQARRREAEQLYVTLRQLFQTGDLSVLQRLGGRTKKTSVSGVFGDETWQYDIVPRTGITGGRRPDCRSAAAASLYPCD